MLFQCQTQHSLIHKRVVFIHTYIQSIIFCDRSFIHSFGERNSEGVQRLVYRRTFATTTRNKQLNTPSETTTNKLTRSCVQSYIHWIIHNLRSFIHSFFQWKNNKAVQSFGLHDEFSNNNNKQTVQRTIRRQRSACIPLNNNQTISSTNNLRSIFSKSLKQEQQRVGWSQNVGWFVVVQFIQQQKQIDLVRTQNLFFAQLIQAFPLHQRTFNHEWLHWWSPCYWVLGQFSWAPLPFPRWRR